MKKNMPVNYSGMESNWRIDTFFHSFILFILSLTHYPLTVLLFNYLFVQAEESFYLYRSYIQYSH